MQVLCNFPVKILAGDYPGDDLFVHLLRRRSLRYIYCLKRHTFRARRNGFWGGGIFCLEYPSTRSEKGNVYFANYGFSFRKPQIFISQTTDFHFANYRFSFRKLQILISQTTDLHFVSFHFVSSHFVSQTTVSL